MNSITSYKINGKPYYIRETDKGIFQAIAVYTINDNAISFESNTEIGRLVVGQDILEVPARSLTLIVRVNGLEPEDSPYN